MVPREKKSDEGTPSKPASGFQLWFEEAWEGWIRPLGGIALLVLAYVVYKFDWVSEGFAGVALVLGVVVGTLLGGALTAWPLVRKSAHKALFIGLLVAWAVACGYPALRAAIPSSSLGAVTLTAAQPSAKAQLKGDGPYDLVVSSHFKQAGMSEAEANYTIKVDGASGSDEVSGSLRRAIVRVRTGRRGGTSASLQEHMETVHRRLPHVRGSELTFTSDGVDEQLKDGLQVTVRQAGLNPLFFVVLGALGLLVALGFDARLTDVKGKAKSYLTAAFGIAYAFALYFYYSDDATPDSLVRPAVGALFFALLAGGLGGWLLGAIARAAFGPKLNKVKKAHR